MKTLTQSPRITDEQSLVSATGRFGMSIPVYDDGFGTLFIHRDSMGISGIVRAQSWEDAYSICEDEFFPDADEEATEKPFDEMTDHEQACWDEAYGFRPNGGIYAKDLNGDSLEPLTAEMMKAWEITLELETEDEPEEEIRWNAWHESRRVNGNGRQVFSMLGRYAPHSRISPRFVSRFRTCLANSHYSPGRDKHAVAW